MSYLVMYGYTLPVQTTPELTRFVMGNVALVTIGVPLVFRVLIQLFGVEKVGSRRVSILSVGIFFLSLVCCGAIFAHAPMLFMLRKMFYAAALVCVLVLLFETFYPLCHQTVALSAVLGMMWVLLYVGGANLLYYFIFNWRNTSVYLINLFFYYILHYLITLYLVHNLNIKHLYYFITK